MRIPLPRSVALQGALTIAALGVVALAPPAEGAMLLVPVAADQPAAIRVATSHGARLIGTGAAGTLLIWADRDVVQPLAAAGVLTLAAPFTACGATPA